MKELIHLAVSHETATVGSAAPLIMRRSFPTNTRAPCAKAVDDEGTAGPQGETAMKEGRLYNIGGLSLTRRALPALNGQVRRALRYTVGKRQSDPEAGLGAAGRPPWPRGGGRSKRRRHVVYRL